MKKLIALLLTSCSLAWGSIEDPRYSEIRLQGTLNFADIVRETESQLGIKIQLPVKNNNNATESYNHIINLKQLIDAVIAHFAQDDIPLDYKFEANTLRFFRLDQTSLPAPMVVTKKKPAPEKVVPKPHYPVPLIREPAPEPKDNPRLPQWLEARKVSALAEIQSPPPTNSTSSSLALKDLDDLPVIPARPQSNTKTGSNSSEAFEVTIPSRQNSRSTPESPRSFGITPYPEDAVAFINDAPSIVAGASKENYIEWTTRMEGLIKNGHQTALDQERRELERRLRWLKDHR